MVILERWQPVCFVWALKGYIWATFYENLYSTFWTNRKFVFIFWFGSNSENVQQKIWVKIPEVWPKIPTFGLLRRQRHTIAKPTFFYSGPQNG